MKKKNAPKKKKGRKKSWIKVCIILLCGYLGINIYIGLSEPVALETVRLGTIEDSITLDGYIIHDQQLLASPVSGSMECIVAEGEKVGKGQVVAAVYEGNLDTKVQERLSRLNERIAELEEMSVHKDVYADDTVKVDQQIGQKVSSVISVTRAGDMKKVGVIKDEINLLINKKQRILGEKGAGSDILSELREEKRQLEAAHNVRRHDVAAPIAGIYSSKLDGFEEVLTPGIIKTLTPNKLDELDKQAGTLAAGVGKIVDSFHWYFVANVDEQSAQALKTGTELKLKFFDIDDNYINGTIEYLSDAQNGKKVIAVKLSGSAAGLIQKSRTSVLVVKHTYGGLKVHTESVRVVDEKSGVYILSSGRAAFREINILYSNKDYAVVEQKDKSNAPNYLLLYDDVVVSGKNLKDGKVIR